MKTLPLASQITLIPQLNDDELVNSDNYRNIVEKSDQSLFSIDRITPSWRLGM